MSDPYAVGKQPCQSLNRKTDGNPHAVWLNVHQCYRCNGTVSFCENCYRDHHYNGYESCKRGGSAAEEQE